MENKITKGFIIEQFVEKREQIKAYLNAPAEITVDGVAYVKKGE